MFAMRRRPLLRGAVVGGAGYMAGKNAARRQQAEADQNERIAALEQQQQQQAPVPPASPPAAPAPPSPAAPAAGGDDTIARLSQLAELHKAGALTDEEFAAAKQKLLG